MPSARLTAHYKGVPFPITLDSGATVSFIALSVVNSLKIPIAPNGQLAQLAIPSVRASSLGEVDFIAIEASFGNINLRLRALVMPTLSVPCFGGRTFHRDNHIIDCASSSVVTIHNKRFTIQLEHQGPPPMPPPTLTTDSQTKNCSAVVQNVPPKELSSVASQTQPSFSDTPQDHPPRLATTVVVKEKTSLLPQGVHPISAQQDLGTKVLVLPPTPPISTANLSLWPPMVCDFVSGSALYVNQTDQPLRHGKHTHVRLIPMKETLVSESNSLKNSVLPISSQPSQQVAKEVLSQINVNSKLLNQYQVGRLDTLHSRHHTAFNEDMSGGFQDSENPYHATFSFKDDNRAPPYKVWAPQYSRQCQDLMQAMCDKLEASNVLVDPSKTDVSVRLVSPCFILQKGRAKHKPLAQCSLEEIRFITCFNSLNDSIHPIPGRSNAYNDIMKFMALHKYYIFADLTSSYFQVKVAKKFWGYLGIMTPYRGLRVMTRLGQGLLNSDVHLEQVVTRVLGDDMLAGNCIIARDDLIVGASSVDECISKWERILAKLDAHNLKLNPAKVRIMPEDAEV